MACVLAVPALYHHLTSVSAVDRRLQGAYWGQDLPPSPPASPVRLEVSGVGLDLLQGVQVPGGQALLCMSASHGAQPVGVLLNAAFSVLKIITITKQ